MADYPLETVGLGVQGGSSGGHLEGSLLGSQRVPFWQKVGRVSPWKQLGWGVKYNDGSQGPQGPQKRTSDVRNSPPPPGFKGIEGPGGVLG